MLNVAIVALLTGLTGLVIGIVARSARVALGCAVTVLMMSSGVAIALWIWEMIA